MGRSNDEAKQFSLCNIRYIAFKKGRIGLIEKFLSFQHSRLHYARLSITSNDSSSSTTFLFLLLSPPAFAVAAFPKRLSIDCCPFSFYRNLTFSFLRTGGNPCTRLFASSNKKISRSLYPLTVLIDHEVESAFLCASLYFAPFRWVVYVFASTFFTYCSPIQHRLLSSPRIK